MIFEGFGTLSFEQKNFHKKILKFAHRIIFSTIFVFEKMSENPGEIRDFLFFDVFFRFFVLIFNGKFWLSKKIRNGIFEKIIR